MQAGTSAKSKRLPATFHFVGGKGGVGKTTCAAAFALGAAATGQRVLVASTDPAPSLGDALKVPLGPAPRRVPVRAGRLAAVEIDAPPALKRWIAERRVLLEKIAVEGTWLDRDDVSRLLNLSLPGIDEVASLLEISRLSRSGRYDLIVVDTAPTGHTLRMLAMPEVLFGIARVFDLMRQKHRVMVEALRGTWAADGEDALIHEVAGQAKDLAAMLRDRARMRLSWVTLPEPMAIAETADALAALQDREVPVRELIVNRVTPAPASRCGHCDARRAFEHRALRGLPSEVPVLTVADRDREPRGVPALNRIAAELSAPASPLTGRAPRVPAWQARAGRKHGPIDAVIPPGLQVVLFGGKGGVGKTTCAAASAIAVAAAHPGKRVLLISIDPAHSLGDVLGTPLSDVPAPVPGAPRNLAARELDAGRVLDEVKRKYAAAIDQVFARFGAGRSFDMGHDRSVMQGLIDLAPPGLDELASIIEIMESVVAKTSGGPDLVLLDTAPTGHALRLLETPVLIQDWTKALMAILLKYQAVTGLGDLGTLLLRLSRGLSQLREILADPARAAFVVVTRPAALPRAETLRLLERLERLRMAVPAVIVNAVGRGTCARCVRAAAAEQREIAALQRGTGGKTGPHLVTTARRIPPPAGAAALRDWQRTAWT